MCFLFFELWSLPYSLPVSAHTLLLTVLRVVCSGCTLRPGETRLMSQASLVFWSPPIPILPVLVGCPRCVFSWFCYFSAAAQRYGHHRISRPHTQIVLKSSRLIKDEGCAFRTPCDCFTAVLLCELTGACERAVEQLQKPMPGLPQFCSTLHR